MCAPAEKISQKAAKSAEKTDRSKVG